MRSLIKSHKQPQPLDTSPVKSSQAHPSNLADGNHYSISFNDSHIYTLNFNSLQRLKNNKFFGSKLFKKSSVKDKCPNNMPIVEPKSIFSSKRYRFKKLGNITPNYLENIPAIKGTRTHSWGDEPNIPYTCCMIEENYVKCDELLKAVDISMVYVSESERASIVSLSNGVNSENEIVPYVEKCDVNDIRYSHGVCHCNLLSISKNKSINKIYTTDTNQQKSNPAFTQKVLKGYIKNKNAYIRNKESSSNDAKSAVYYTDKKNADIKNKSSVSLNSLDLSFKLGSENRVKLNDNINYDAESEEEPSESSSKFSFEIDVGLDGRTSSIKYYSKTSHKPNIYIDDTYENENFDEDMNICDDLDINGIHINDNREYLSPNIYSTVSCSEIKRSVSLNHSDNMITKKNKNVMTSFNDIYDLSDDAEDDRDLYCEKYSYVDDDDLPNKKSLQSYTDIYLLSDDDSSVDQSSNFNTSLLISTCKDDVIADNSEHINYFSPKLIQSFQIWKNQLMDEYYNVEYDGFSRGYESNLLYLSTSDCFESAKNKQDKSQFNLQDKSVDIESDLKSYSDIKGKIVKYHDLNSNLDNETRITMGNLYFIDETEEDLYNKEHAIDLDDECLDEINKIPEDFSFSDNDSGVNITKSPITKPYIYSFKKTHSYAERPLGMIKESSPIKSQLKIKNKTVTFFRQIPMTILPNNYLHNIASSKSPTSSVSPDISSSVVDSSLLTEPLLESSIQKPLKFDGPLVLNVSNQNLPVKSGSFNKFMVSFTELCSLDPIRETTLSTNNPSTLK